MQKIFIFTLLLLAAWTKPMQAQGTFDGNYTGQLNGDNVSLSLQSVGQGKYSGQMADSQQQYTVEGRTEGKQFIGTATEKTWGLTFQLKGTREASALNMTLTITVLGQASVQNVAFTKVDEKPKPNTTQSMATASAKKSSIPGNVKNANHDANITGVWQQEEHYNSGYGSDAFAGSNISRVTFFADGTLSDGGTQTTISGSNYSGSSGGTDGNNILENVWWYSKDNHIFLYVSKDGQNQTVDWGKYYIERGRMLVTAANGKKTLLTKIR